MIVGINLCSPEKKNYIRHSKYVRFGSIRLNPENCLLTVYTDGLKDDDGNRKITTRSSSTLDASSGMVSGKTQSFGEETHEPYKTANYNYIYSKYK